LFIIEETETKSSRQQTHLKCSSCKEKFERENIVKRSGKNYCPECLKQYEQSLKVNKSDYNLLFDYICELYEIPVLTGLMFKQLKDYRNDGYNYTDIGMYYTLKYYFGVLENQVLENTGLGIIPYYYDKAKQHYNKVYDLVDLAEELEVNERTQIVKTKDRKRTEEKRTPLPLIDWEDIDENS